MKKIFVAIVVIVSAVVCGCSAEKTVEENLKCSVKVNCEAILQEMDKLVEPKRELVPEDGIIIFKEDVAFGEGETAFEVVKELFAEEKIQFEYEKLPAYDSVYIEGIGNIYEKDAGDVSGWSYMVNGEYTATDLSKYVLNDGDFIEFIYIVSF